MADNKTVTQVIKLDTKEFIGPLNQVRASAKSVTDDINKDFTNNQKVLASHESQVKKWGSTITEELGKAGKAAANNLKTGAQVMALDFGREALHKAGGDAIKMAFSFSKAFAEIKSRSNASESDLARWRKSLMDTSASTTANMDSMAESFKDMFSSVKNPEELLKIMDSIGNAAAMGDGDATKVSSMVKKTLTDQGREVNDANVKDVLGSSDVLRRKGNGFSDLGAANDALGSMKGGDIANSGMSMRQIANAMAAATQASGGAQGVEAIKTLIAGSSSVESRERLKAGLGLGMNKNGQLDLSSLGSSAYSKKVMGLGNDDSTRLMVLKSLTGASDEAAQAFLNIAKKGEVFSKSLESAQGDTQTFAESAEKAKDNLENAFKGFESRLIVGVSDILGGLEKPFKALISGHPLDAAKAAPGALWDAGKGALAHPMMTAAAVAGTIGVGAIVNSVLGKMSGKGGTVGLATGVGIGNALKQAGVTPVYVVNAGDIGKDQSMLPSAVSKMMGGGAEAAAEGAAGAAAKSTGFLSKLAGLGKYAKIAGGVATVAAQGIETYGEYNDAKDEHGKNMALAKGGAGAVGGVSGLYAGAALGAAIGSVVPVVGTAIGGVIGGAIGAYSGQQIAQKIVIEIDSKDEKFMGRPKSTDNQRDSRAQ